MVQFIPSAPGTMPYKSPVLAQILQGMGGVGQMLGGADANGNQGGIAAIINAIHGRQPLQQFLNVPQPPAGQPNPLGPLAQTPVNRIQQVSDAMGKTGVSGILNQGSQTTLYMSPDGSLSMTPTPGAIPLGGFKGPTAASAMQSDKRLKLQQEHQAMLEKFKQAQTDTGLSADDKRIIAVARTNAMALSNPMADFSDEDMSMMRETFKKANAILSKSAGATPAPPEGAAAPKSTAKVAKTPAEYLRLNFPTYPETPKNLAWAKEQMSGAK